jgi:hypothetical protein
MSDVHVIEITEVTTIVRTIELKKSDYKSKLEAERFIGDALNNVPFEDVGILKKETVEELINGRDIDLDDAETD